MGLVRRPAYAVLVVLAVLAAGCGGGSTKASSTWGGPTGASLAPASALGFVAVNTDKSSSQWKNADALLKKFPGRDKLLASIEKSLSSNGVDFNTKILPLLGPELDLVVLDGGGSSRQLVGMTKPTDAGAFNGYLDAANPPSPHMELDGWTIFARSQAALDAFTTEQAKGKLADDASFKEATGDLPSDANGIGYLNGAQAVGLLKGTVPQLGALPTGQLQWLAVALSSQSDSAKLDGVVKTSQSFGTPFKAKLLSQVPLGALAVVSFHGSAQLTSQLTQNPAVTKAAGPVKQFLGVALNDLTALVEGEGALYVAEGIPYPEVTLILEQRHPEAAMATMNTIAEKLATSFKGKLTDYPGSDIKKLHLGGIAIYYGIVNRNLIISDASGHLLTGPGVPLFDDPVYTKAREAAGLPDQRAGLVYLNLKKTIPLLQNYVETLGATVPRDVLLNLAPLESFIAYATGDGSVTKFSALLKVR